MSTNEKRQPLDNLLEESCTCINAADRGRQEQSVGQCVQFVLVDLTREHDFPFPFVAAFRDDRSILKRSLQRA